MAARLTCYGITTKGVRCKIDWDLNANGYCAKHVGQDQSASQASAVSSPSTPPASSCYGITTKGVRCKIDWDLNANGYCAKHVGQDQSASQASAESSPSTVVEGNHSIDTCCRGTSIRGRPCKITTDLNSSGYCKFHADQDPDAPMKSPCAGTTVAGTPCKITWDLNEAGLCVFHVLQTSDLDKSLHTESSSPTSGLEDSGTRLGNETPTDSTDLDVDSETSSSTDETEASQVEEDVIVPIPRVRISDAARCIPNLWKATYDKMNSKVTVSILSEVSRKCFHEPIEIKAPKWAVQPKKVKTTVSVGGTVASLAPVVGATAHASSQAVVQMIEYANTVWGALTYMGIENGGNYVANAQEGSQIFFDDKWALDTLLSCHSKNFKTVHFGNIAQLISVDHGGKCVWLHEDEETKSPVASVVQDVTQNDPVAESTTVGLVFEAVTYILLKKKKNKDKILVHWEVIDVETKESLQQDNTLLKTECWIPNLTDDLERYDVRLTVHDTKKKQKIGEIRVGLKRLCELSGSSAKAVELRVSRRHHLHVRVVQPPNAP